MGIETSRYIDCQTQVQTVNGSEMSLSLNLIFHSSPWECNNVLFYDCSLSSLLMIFSISDGKRMYLVIGPADQRNILEESCCQRYKFSQSKIVLDLKQLTRITQTSIAKRAHVRQKTLLTQRHWFADHNATAQSVPSKIISTGDEARRIPQQIGYLRS